MYELLVVALFIKLILIVYIIIYRVVGTAISQTYQQSVSDYDNNLKTDTGEQLSGEPTVTNRAAVSCT